MNMPEMTTEKHQGHHSNVTVPVTIDGREIEIPAGEYQVISLKSKLGAPPEYELEIVRHGQFHPLVDTSHVHIRGGEEFVSHVRCGASS